MLETSKILENVQKSLERPFRLVNIINTDVEICVKTILWKPDSATVMIPENPDVTKEGLYSPGVEVPAFAKNPIHMKEIEFTWWMAHSILESTEVDDFERTSELQQHRTEASNIKHALQQRIGNVHRVVRLDNDFNNDLNLGGICSVDGLTYFIYVRITDSDNL